MLLETLVDKLPTGTWRESFLEEACRFTLQENPPGAIQLAQHLQPGTNRTRTLLMIADDWTVRDPVAAARWIATEPTILLRDELITAGSTALASTDPLSAYTWTTRIASPSAFECALDRITTLWTSYAPDQVRQFSLRLDTPDSSAPDPPQNSLR